MFHQILQYLLQQYLKLLLMKHNLFYGYFFGFEDKRRQNYDKERRRAAEHRALNSRRVCKADVKEDVLNYRLKDADCQHLRQILGLRVKELASCYTVNQDCYYSCGKKAHARKEYG